MSAIRPIRWVAEPEFLRASASVRPGPVRALPPFEQRIALDRRRTVDAARTLDRLVDVCLEFGQAAKRSPSHGTANRHLTPIGKLPLKGREDGMGRAAQAKADLTAA